MEHMVPKYDVDDSVWTGISIDYMGLHLPWQHHHLLNMPEHEGFPWEMRPLIATARVSKVSDTPRSYMQGMRDSVGRSRCSCLLIDVVGLHEDIVPADCRSMLAIAGPFSLVSLRTNACAGARKVGRLGLDFAMTFFSAHSWEVEPRCWLD